MLELKTNPFKPLMEDSDNSLPLHHCHVHKTWAYLNRTYTLFHSLTLATIFYYRGSFFLNKNDPKYQKVPFFPWLALFVAELILSILWLLKQAFYWRPVTRTAFPERLPRDEHLPGIDVFICTADPEREPTWEVMNNVISAMALDYPVEKLSVYLSDDGGASVTLKGMKEAWVFATWWLPFCRKYKVKSICPRVYFEKEVEEENQNREFVKDRQIVKARYEIFKQQMQSKIGRDEAKNDANIRAQDHPALIQVISKDSILNENAATINPEQVEMPLLVYVAREKRPSSLHNFKAGALNVLLRVSSTMSNSPYALVLDCDMYCNDSISARQAMCFYLDPKFFPSLAWVQYPQKFHNVNENDIYDSQMRTLWPVCWPGADGIQGPVICGTNFYIKREALYDVKIHEVGNNLREMKDSFGVSNEFIKSINQIYKPNTKHARELSSVLLQEAEFLASCTYESGTKWGETIGFRYGTVVEDVMTANSLQSKGWRSVYLNPQRPQFLGSAITNLNEALIQGIRWLSGILGIGLSKHCPLVYRPSKMPLLQKMFSSWLALFSLDFISILTFATVPPLCFLHGIPLYPKVLDPFMLAFVLAFISSQLRQLYDFHISGGSIRACLNEQQTWMIKAVTCNVYGTLECVMNKLRLRETTFIPTNKAGDDDKTKYYEMGKYDFRTSNMFLVPLGTLVTLNVACFIGGVARVIVSRNWDAMFVQMMLSLFVVVMNFPVIEGMLLRKDNGRFCSSATLICFMACFVFLSLDYFII